MSIKTRITEDYCGFETAKLLKEKGFREITNRYYNAQYNQIRTVSDTFMMDWNDEEYMRSITMPGSVSIPTIQMAMKWLREVHHIHIEVHLDSMDGRHPIYEALYSECINIRTNNFIDYGDTYEQACETAIKYCLTYLI